MSDTELCTCPDCNANGLHCEYWMQCAQASRPTCAGCASSCDHRDIEKRHCLDCGKDMTERLAEEAEALYDAYKHGDFNE